MFKLVELTWGEGIYSKEEYYQETLVIAKLHRVLSELTVANFSIHSSDTPRDASPISCKIQNSDNKQKPKGKTTRHTCPELALIMGTRLVQNLLLPQHYR